MRGVKERDPLNGGELVVHENLQVKISKQVQVYLITIIPDGHDESALFVNEIDPLI